MLIFQNSKTINFPFSEVCFSILNRYERNPFSAHVTSCDVLSRRIVDGNVLETVQLQQKLGKIPSWAISVISLLIKDVNI